MSEVYNPMYPTASHLRGKGSLPSFFMALTPMPATARVHTTPQSSTNDRDIERRGRGAGWRRRRRACWGGIAPPPRAPCSCGTGSATLASTAGAPAPPPCRLPEWSASSVFASHVSPPQKIKKTRKQTGRTKRKSGETVASAAGEPTIEGRTGNQTQRGKKGQKGEKRDKSVRCKRSAGIGCSCRLHMRIGS
eukprot:1192707-Prorocentrum_minimum.AAC.1